MFTDATLKKYNISEKNKFIGKLEVNDNLLLTEKFIHPLIREMGIKKVTKIGDRNYEKLNQYIINCLKDYYARLMNTTSTSERNRMLATYNHLYDMWRDLHNHKKGNNIVEMDKTYDLFSYELYVLGYTE